MTFTLGALLLGLLVGVRHAFEPDHLAAVGTLVSDARGPLRAAGLGAAWGLGHTAALGIVACALGLLGATLPAGMQRLLELGVAVMLLVLGARGLVQAVRDHRRGPAFEHAHGRAAHAHGGQPAHVHVAGRTLALRPFLVGVMHGLAGSGAVTALVTAAFTDVRARVAYVLLFGLGSVLGMAAVSGLAGWPLARLAQAPRAQRAFSVSIALLAIVTGVVWGWRVV
jgi:hypothetical protein